MNDPAYIIAMCVLGFVVGWKLGESPAVFAMQERLANLFSRRNK